MALERELAYYDQIKPELLKNHAGKFSLIKGEEFIGAFDTMDNAYAEGVKRFGTEPFLIRRITEQAELHQNLALSLGLLHARL